MGKKKNKQEKINITEEEGIHVQWYEDARKVTRDTLPKFISHLMDDYNHDYGTYVHAVTACALATTWACGTELSGFQASVVNILYPRNYWYSDVKTGISIRNWDDMLYPSSESKFDKVMSKRIFEALQDEARLRLIEYNNSENKPMYSPKVIEHWQYIAGGIPPFGYEVVDPDKEIAEEVEDVDTSDYIDHINDAECEED